MKMTWRRLALGETAPTADPASLAHSSVSSLSDVLVARSAAPVLVVLCPRRPFNFGLAWEVVSDAELLSALERGDPAAEAAVLWLSPKRLHLLSFERPAHVMRALGPWPHAAVAPSSPGGAITDILLFRHEVARRATSAGVSPLTQRLMYDVLSTPGLEGLWTGAPLPKWRGPNPMSSATSMVLAYDGRRPQSMATSWRGVISGAEVHARLSRWTAGGIAGVDWAHTVAAGSCVLAALAALAGVRLCLDPACANAHESCWTIPDVL